MTKLDEWQAILKEYDEANKQPIADQERLRNATMAALDTSMHAFRRLLAIAEAVTVFCDRTEDSEMAVLSIMPRVPIYMRERDKLVEALKVLEQP